MTDDLKFDLDVASILTLVGWAVGMLPAIATSLTIIWTLLRIWESPTFQTWWNKKKGEGPKPPPAS